MIEHYLGFLPIATVLYVAMWIGLCANNCYTVDWWCLIFLFMFSYFTCTCMWNSGERNHSRWFLFFSPFICFISLCFVWFCFALLCFVLFCFVLFTSKRQRNDRDSECEWKKPLKSVSLMAQVYAYMWVLMEKIVTVHVDMLGAFFGRFLFFLVVIYNFTIRPFMIGSVLICWLRFACILSLVRLAFVMFGDADCLTNR